MKWVSLLLLGSLSNNDVDGYKNMNLHRFKLYHAYSISFTSSNVGKCFWSWILRDSIKLKEKKRKLLSCVPVLDKTWIQALSHCSRAMTAKKCTKKAWCTCKVVVLLIKPTALLLFSLPSTSSLLKLPIYLHTTPVSTVYQKLKLAVINGMLPIEYSMQRK